MRRGLHILHWIIIFNFVIGIGYACFMVFSTSEIHTPLLRRVSEIPFELMLYRRLYALEAWLIIVGFALYLGVTEILPRRLGRS